MIAAGLIMTYVLIGLALDFVWQPEASVKERALTIPFWPLIAAAWLAVRNLWRR